MDNERLARNWMIVAGVALVAGGLIGFIPGNPIARIAQASTFPILGDTGDTPRQTLHTACYDNRQKPFSGWNADLPTGGRHADGNIFVFADGHARWFKANLNLVDPYGVGVLTPEVLPNRSWFQIDYQGP